MVDKRKASDVLLSLEERVKKIEGAVAVIDLNVKSMLNKLNLSSTSFASDAAPRRRPQAKPAAGPIVQAPIPTLEDVTFPEAVPEASKRKSVVEQRVVYSDGRPVILASVTVSETQISTNIIDKVKTDSHGKWHSQLFGGKYIVEVIKGPTAAKPGFKVEYKIEVPGDGRPLSLERKQV